MEYKTINRNEILIMGKKIVTSTDGSKNFSDIPKFWNTILSDGTIGIIHNNSNIVNHNEYGVCRMLDNHGLEYFVGVEVDSILENGLEYMTIPEATYLVFRTKPIEPALFSKEIQDTTIKIYREFLPKSNYKYANGKLDFELYDSESNKELRCMSIYVPVEKK